MTQNRDDCKQFCWQVAAIGRPFWFCDVAVTLDQRHDAKQGRLRAVHQQVAAIGHLFWYRDMVVAAAGYQKNTQKNPGRLEVGNWVLLAGKKGGAPTFRRETGPAGGLG
jgi:hypothetical protein